MVNKIHRFDVSYDVGPSNSRTNSFLRGAG